MMAILSESSKLRLLFSTKEFVGFVVTYSGFLFTSFVDSVSLALLFYCECVWFFWLGLLLVGVKGLILCMSPLNSRGCMIDDGWTE